MDIAGDTYSVAGSSPLARGLLVHADLEIGFARIIPARAGFTLRTRRTATPIWDHPRSRGVYSWAINLPHFSLGSSPLARGLRRQTILPSLSSRIIPARAGFTQNFILIHFMARDHPRSRGVYADCADSLAVCVGSSPLARGLPSGWGRPASTRGIIPARAGFTCGSGCGTSGGLDHPRSRGVYARISGVTSDGMGSSPLARGLRMRCRG